MLKFNIYSVHLVIFQCPKDGIRPKYRQIKISYEILIIIKISKKRIIFIKDRSTKKLFLIFCKASSLAVIRDSKTQIGDHYPLKHLPIQLGQNHEKHKNI